MFFTTFKVRVLVFIRDFSMLVWTLVFPLGMATLFYFTIGSLDENTRFQKIPTGIVKDEAYQKEFLFGKVLDTVSDSFLDAVSFSSEDEAMEALEKDEILGYISLKEESPALTVKSNGLSQTILKSFLDQYLVMKNAALRILKENSSASLGALFSTEDFIRSVSLTDAPPSDELNYFYALIALSCLYGGFMGLDLVTLLQGNLSPLGARRTVSSSRRLTTVLADLSAAVFLEFCFMAILVIYIRFVLGLALGENIFWLFVTAFAGSLLGVLSGALIGSSNRFRYRVKSAVFTVATMACSFLAGLMIQNMNYIIREKAPIIDFLNPAARISDAFYCLYCYGANGRYFENLAYLILLSVIFFFIILFFLRRQIYESI